VKVVINGTYGGFGLSEEAVKEYAKLKGLTLTITKTEYGSNVYWTNKFWEGKYKGPLSHKEFMALDEKNQKEYLQSSISAMLVVDEIPRNDVTLIRVVEKLGNRANGPYAELYIEEVYGEHYTIDEYDGCEQIRYLG
jgi:hypothetical protein